MHHAGAQDGERMLTHDMATLLLLSRLLHHMQQPQILHSLCPSHYGLQLLHVCCYISMVTDCDALFNRMSTYLWSKVES